MDDVTWSVKQLKTYQDRINRELERFLARKRKEIQKEAPETLNVYDALARYILRGGKRIRPALVYYSYKLCGGEGIDKEVVQISMASDLNHSYLLIHDDIMDNGLVRRGKPSLHVELAGIYRKQRRTDADHLGVAQAILMGDFAAAFAIEAISSTSVSKELGHKVLEAHTRMLEETEIGQGLDIHFSSRRRATEEDVRRIMEYKTARYTVLSPLRTGAILAGASNAQFNALEQFALRVGTVFQIADDLLGMFGTEKEIGKSNLSDLREGKHTLLTVRAYRGASANDKRYLDSVLGNPEASRKDLSRVRAIMKETGAYEETLEEARTLTQEALKALGKEKFPGEEAERFFRGMGEYVLSRTH